MYPGKFIAFEGLDCSGKTTQAELLVQWLSTNVKGRQVVYTREPSDGVVGSQIRLALYHVLDLNEKALGALFAADRSDHLTRTIIPELQRGHIIVCDRYYLSSLAFQSLYLPSKYIEDLNEGALKPHLIIFLRVSPETSMQRRTASRVREERYETPDILPKVAEAYDRLVPHLKEESEPIVEIDGNGSIDAIHSKVVEVVKTILPNLDSL